MAEKNQKKAAARKVSGVDDPPPHIPIVAIGSSAGGLHALQMLFDNLPVNLGAAFVVISHLDPTHRSELGPILARHTLMPVHEVQEPRAIEGNHVYVIPPGRKLVIVDHGIATRKFDEPRGQRAPIDQFFRSAATSKGDGYGVILSGAGADGSVGIKSIKESGGIILVQDPNEAEYPSMPRAAIATGCADAVLPMRDLARRLTEFIRNRQQILPESFDASGQEAVRRVLAYLSVRTGHDFSGYKRATVMRRLTRRMQLNRIDRVDQYLAFIKDNPDEAQALFGDLLISVTTFFRDAGAFEALAKKVIPKLFDEDGVTSSIRVWVPGAATGEEAYSIAMLISEEAERRDCRPEVQIFATDLDLAALATAREARYPIAIAADVSDERLRRHFTRDGDHYRVKKDIRDMVVIAAHSVLKDPPFSRLDLVSCRNLLIYLERELQQQVCATLLYALKPGRFLFLGSAETAEGMPDMFRPIDRENRIYQAMEPPGEMRLALPRLMLAPHVELPRVASRSAEPPGEASLHRLALEALAPPSMVVDERHKIVHLSESAGRYLLPSGGTFSADLSQLARPELRLDIYSGLQRAFEQGESTLSLPVSVKFNGSSRRICVQVRPTPRAENAAKLALVMFLDGGEADIPKNVQTADGTLDAERMQRLQQELQLTRERLRTSREEFEGANEELRAANEELQSLNEEYRSTAEELETSKEELQSINEELQTLNNELKNKYEGVSRAHNDLQNLIAATEVGTLFFDRSLRIKLFTERIADLFNITAHDEGRPISNFTHQLLYDGLVDDAHTVLKSSEMLEREVQSKAGRWYLLRMRPYRTLDDKIDGVVVTFVDVTNRKHREGELRRLYDEAGATSQRLANTVRIATLACEAGRMGTWHLDLKKNTLDFSDELFVLLGIDPKQWPGTPQGFEAYIHPDDVARRREDRTAAFEHGEELEHDFRVLGPGGAVLWCHSRGSIVRDAKGNASEAFGVLIDITERKAVEDQLRRSEFLLKAAAENAGVGLCMFDRDHRYVFANRAYSQMLQLEGELIGKRPEDVRQSGSTDQVAPSLDLAFEGKRVSYELDRADGGGEHRYFNVVYEPMLDDRGAVAYVIVVTYDISNPRQAAQRIAQSEEQLRLANEAAGIGTFSIDPRTGITQYSPQLTAMLGIPGTRIVKLEQAFARIHRDDVQRVQALYAAALNPAGDGRLRMEFRFVKPGGAVRWMTWNGRIEFADFGKGREPSRIIGACADITERKQAESNLLASEARYRSVVEGSLQGIIIQQNERIVYANSAMARIFGYERPEDLIGKSTFDDFVAPEDRALLRERTARAYRGETVTPHPGWRGFRKDGTEIWVSAMAHRAEWQGKPAVVSFYLDITERKTSEQKLAETLRMMKVATSAGKMGTWHFQPQTGRLDYSDEGLELLGIDKQKWNYSIDAVEAVMHPEDVKRRRQIIANATASQSDVEFEFRVLRPDGEVRWMMVRGHVVRRPDGQSFDALGVVLDITERRNAQERQQILIRELDHRVKNSLANLQLVMQRSREQTNSIDEFKAALEGRLMSMATMHSRLSKGGWTGVSLVDIVNDSLAPYAGSNNIDVAGPAVMLTPAASQALAMVLFELATNAAKYGSLLVPTGKVHVRWQLTQDAVPQHPKSLVVTWEETGGPAISLPAPRGYGSSVIQDLIPYELKGSTCSFEIGKAGARCRIEIPAQFLARPSS